MKTWLILVLLAALPWGLSAQNSTQQQLPTAPSTTKFPPQQSAPPPPSGSSQPNTPAQSPAPATPSTGSQFLAPPNQSTAPAASADHSAGNGDSPDETLTVIRKRVDEVNVVFTVTDKRGHFVKDLTQNDFRVIDDGKPAESIRSFSRETNLPLRVGLLIDASNSVRDRFKFEQEAAIEFLNQIIRLEVRSGIRHWLRYHARSNTGLHRRYRSALPWRAHAAARRRYRHV